MEENKKDGIRIGGVGKKERAYIGEGESDFSRPPMSPVKRASIRSLEGGVDGVWGRGGELVPSARWVNACSTGYSCPGYMLARSWDGWLTKLGLRSARH
uniref:Uncharacterized protein n=1 Tax=Knipowitschia caucasica TaxID=637954 RepID=A0AAV2LTW1_KNICA